MCPTIGAQFIPALAGPFILAAAAYLAAGTVLSILLRPDPLLLSRHLFPADTEPVRGATAPAARKISRGVAAGALTMVIAQVVMTGIMTMTPVHMQMHHHTLSAVGVVIGVHIAAMYLPSLVTGALVDRVGTTAMAVASGVALVLAGIAGATLGESVAASFTALVLLGLGWNLGIIAGTTMIVDATTRDERARVQGNIDVLIALAGASGGALSGVVMAATTYSGLTITGAVVALASLPAIAVIRRRRA